MIRQVKHRAGRQNTRVVISQKLSKNRPTAYEPNQKSQEIPELYDMQAQQQSWLQLQLEKHRQTANLLLSCELLEAQTLDEKLSNTGEERNRSKVGNSFRMVTFRDRYDVGYFEARRHNTFTQTPVK